MNFRRSFSDREDARARGRVEPAKLDVSSVNLTASRRIKNLPDRSFCPQSRNLSLDQLADGKVSHHVQVSCGSDAYSNRQIALELAGHKLSSRLFPRAIFAAITYIQSVDWRKVK